MAVAAPCRDGGRRVPMLELAGLGRGWLGRRLVWAAVGFATVHDLW